MKTTYIALVVTSIVSAPIFADTVCANENLALNATTPISAFTVNNNGTVTHESTNLMWMQCSLGQTWDSSGCSGAVDQFTWVDALGAAESQSFAGHDDWRLPNRNELQSIVEGRCWRPSINEAIFPSTPSAAYWTSTPYADSGRYAHFVSFLLGNVTVGLKSGNNTLGGDGAAVRLVRDDK